MSDLLRRWYPDAPDAVLAHVASCVECGPDSDERYGLWLCGIGKHVNDPEQWGPDGEYRRIYGPPVPRELRLKQAKTPFERATLEMQFCMEDDLKRQLFGDRLVNPLDDGNKITFNVISRRDP